MSPDADPPRDSSGPTEDEVARIVLGGWKGLHHTRHLDPASWEALVASYGRGASMRSLAREFNVPEEAVAKELRRRGITIRPRGQARRKRTLREDAFDAIGEESAYWVGFLLSRGYVTSVGDARILGVRLRSGDAAHLERLRAFLGSDHKIGRRGAAVELRVSSARLVEALARYGVGARQSRAPAAAGLERDRHFWRGVVDGGGALEIVDGSPMLSLRGPRALLRRFAAYVRQASPGCRVGVRPAGAEYRCSLGGEAARDVVRLLYEGGVVALERNQAVAQR